MSVFGNANLDGTFGNYGGIFGPCTQEPAQLYRLNWNFWPTT